MKNKHRQRYLLPGQYLGSITTHPTVAAALHRARPVLLPIWGIPLGAYVWRGTQTGEWGWSLIGLVISSLFGYMVWHDLVTGFTHNNHGEFLRADRPFGYWLSILFLVVGYLFGVAGLVLADCGTPS